MVQGARYTLDTALSEGWLAGVGHLQVVECVSEMYVILGNLIFVVFSRVCKVEDAPTVEGEITIPSHLLAKAMVDEQNSSNDVDQQCKANKYFRWIKNQDQVRHPTFRNLASFQLLR